jgi:hypothetical protein
MLVIGPLAGTICSKLEPSRSLPTILLGFTIQGVGFLVSLMVYSAFIYRLMSQKLPKESMRPGMFVSVGPSGFTVAGIINMATEARRAFPADFLGNGLLAATIFRVTVNFAALWLWGYDTDPSNSGFEKLIIDQISHLFLLCGKFISLVCSWPWTIIILYELVFFHFSEHCLGYCNICYWEILLVQGY